ncbi:MAG: hypothetical protein DHS20C11_01070 [Lysobacteraceae bacterium]|nr:MAG: hypothetical protein DHS20C11_01070 [Xanthomonadaceae bacterium]
MKTDKDAQKVSMSVRVRKPSKHKTPGRFFGVLAGLAVLGGFVSYWHWVSEIHPIESGAGTLGDSFGPLTSLFTGLAFVGLVVTLLLQRADLRHQMMELEETRGDANRRGIEATYFQMLRLWSESVHQLETKNHCGRQVVSLFFNKMSGTGDLQIHESFNEVWHNRGFDELLEPIYSKFLFEILLFIETRTETTDTQSKVLYQRLLRAQLSKKEFELVLHIIRHKKCDSGLERLFGSICAIEMEGEGENRDFNAK